MNLKASLLFAKRIIFPKDGRLSIARKSLGGAVLCIGISLIPLVVLLTVSNGMIEGITRRLISLSSSHIEAVSLSDASIYSGGKAGQGLEKEAESLALSNAGILYSYPMISSSALAISGGKKCGVSLRAVPPEVFRDSAAYRELFRAEGEGGSEDDSASRNDSDSGSDSAFASGNASTSIEDFWAEVGGKKSVLIGKGISEKLGLAAGDKIRLVTINKGRSGSIAPAVHSYNIAAVISCGYRELDALWLFLPYDEGLRILQKSEAQHSIMIETADPFSPEIVGTQASVQKALGKKFRVYRWDELNRAQYENFSSTKMLLIFIQLLIVLTATVNISSALIMLIMERRREIAILKALGASSSGISAAFLVTGFSCGAAGLLLGIPAGLFLSVNINGIIALSEKIINFFAQGLYFLLNNDIIGFTEIHILDESYYLKEIPVEIPFGELFLIGAATLLLSVALSAVPAAQAGRQRPLKTLRESR